MHNLPLDYIIDPIDYVTGIGNAHTVNSGELRIPYPVHNNSGLRDREIYDLFLP